MKKILCASFVFLLLISLFCFHFVDAADTKSLKTFPGVPPEVQNNTGAQFDQILKDRKPYIIYMGEGLKNRISTGSVRSFYEKMLEDIIGSKESVSRRIINTYERSFYGFVVMLTDTEAKAAKSLSGVVSVFPNWKLKPDTTRSWDFLGMPLKVTRNLTMESDIIIGVIDSGIWPESASFNDEGLGPVPARWKGTCQTSTNFTCNRKIIGARFFRGEGSVPEGDEPTPRDMFGHGTHTASTIAGALVDNASYLGGVGNGTARGGVPSARIAVYKALWSDNVAFASDVLAAFDCAIADGVDVISVSIGFSDTKKYFENPIDIGAFHAMKKGIFTSASAGNNGPNRFSVRNVAPWSLTVAASTIDRLFLTSVKLGNGDVFQGVSVNPNDLINQALIYGGDAQNKSSTADSRVCAEDSLDPTLVKGKIVLCEGRFPNEAFLSGASGAILVDDTGMNNPRIAPLPTSHVSLDNGTSVFRYTRDDTRPMASIFKTTENNDMTAPVVASFSSRGPNSFSPGILKPDVSAPGVAILAAWSEANSPTSLKEDIRRVSYNIISGTSMACPHASAIAAYVKSFHTTWSPSAIKSALMTTATPMNSKLQTDGEFAYGAGHINPIKALNPGLVYDAGESDYVNFLCGEGFSDTNLQLTTGNDKISCDKARSMTNSDLNYPSITLKVDSPLFSQKINRVVTNVGLATSSYKVFVTSPASLLITVVPNTLHFASLEEVQSYSVTIRGAITVNLSLSAALVWDDGIHQVRSPIIVYRLS